MDERFVKKVYRSVVLAWVTAMTWTLAFQKPWIALSITLGVVLGTAVLASYDLAVRKAFVPGTAKPARALLKLGLVKYPAIGMILYGLVRWDSINLPAFCGGIMLVHFAIFAKFAGVKMMERRKALTASAGISDPVVPSKES